MEVGEQEKRNQITTTKALGLAPHHDQATATATATSAGQGSGPLWFRPAKEGTVRKDGTSLKGPSKHETRESPSGKVLTNPRVPISHRHKCPRPPIASQATLAVTARSAQTYRVPSTPIYPEVFSPTHLRTYHEERFLTLRRWLCDMSFRCILQ